MEALIKKIEALKDLVKAVKAMASPVPSMPTIKPISISAPSVPAKSKMPGVNPNAKKDPKKVAEQLKNADVQKLKAPVLKADSNGQWKLD